MPSPLVPVKERVTGVGPRATLPPPPSHRLVSCRISCCCWAMQEEKGRNRRRCRRTSRSRSRMSIVGTGLLLGEREGPHPHFHRRLSSVGLPGKVSAASSVLCPETHCKHLCTSHSPAFPHNAAAAVTAAAASMSCCQHGLLSSSRISVQLDICRQHHNSHETGCNDAYSC